MGIVEDFTPSGARINTGAGSVLHWQIKEHKAGTQGNGRPCENVVTVHALSGKS